MSDCAAWLYSPQLSPATPSRSQSRSSAALSGLATPPKSTPSTRPLHCSSLGPVGGSTRLRPSQPQGSIKRRNSRLPLPSPASDPAAWLEAGPISTHYSLEVKPRTRLAPSALGLQVMRPARDSESRPLRSLSVLPNGLTRCGLPLPSHFPTRPPAVLRSAPGHPFASTTFPRGSPLGLQLGDNSPAPPLPGDSLLRPDPFPLATWLRAVGLGPDAGILGRAYPGATREWRGSVRVPRPGLHVEAAGVKRYLKILTATGG